LQIVKQKGPQGPFSLTHNEIFVILYTKDVNNSMTDQTESKKFTDALKDALAKKHAAQHPDAKTKKGKDGKSKKSGTPVIGGRPVQRTVGRGG
jgi:hypothetical protein